MQALMQVLTEGGRSCRAVDGAPVVLGAEPRGVEAAYAVVAVDAVEGAPVVPGIVSREVECLCSLRMCKNLFARAVSGGRGVEDAATCERPAVNRRLLPS